MKHTRRPLHAGQHAVITGGSSGLGLEIAQQLAARGLRLTLVARNANTLAAAAAEIIENMPRADVRTLAVDVCDTTELAATFATLTETGDDIDVLINSAGILREGYFEKLAAADFADVMNVNFFGTLNAARAALPYLKASHGRIVNIASIAGLTGVFGYTPYCASKHALVGFTDSLRFELEPQGVHVHLVCPGEFDSPMVDVLDRTRSPENRAHTLTIPKLGVRQVAAETIAGVDRGQRTIVPGRRAKMLVTAQRMAPGIADRIARRRIGAAYRGPA